MIPYLQTHQGRIASKGTAPLRRTTPSCKLWGRAGEGVLILCSRAQGLDKVGLIGFNGLGLGDTASVRGFSGPQTGSEDSKALRGKTDSTLGTPRRKQNVQGAGPVVVQDEKPQTAWGPSGAQGRICDFVVGGPLGDPH